ncbi:winged helix-turn-helix transcriptional regulator [Helicobacter sp. 11S03491-1]|uniref:winged helix-turn-helix transcriptional regulator n=1 Tax=Helicobacter sp. 11S03491-1 TaxID=1476196 RepID=UPI000BA50F60|nr:winged helix-turn-helix transcriptional regulator [Helicobacter sp. 11S03491-1]PAF42732.1 hypothetical protein BKH45_03965 [Helicobacter sp. 11S03491-1]
MKQNKKYAIDNLCPVSYFGKIFNDRWKLYIAYKLLDGKKRFKDLRDFFEPYMTQKTLCIKLKELEEEQIIQREVFSEIPPRVEYHLTNKGKELASVLECIYQWGDSYVCLKN